jgi:hypothetical protein
MTDAFSPSEIRIRPNWIANRSLVIFRSFVLICSFKWSYPQYLNPAFGCHGYSHSILSTRHPTLAWILGVLPSIWLSDRLPPPSQSLHCLQAR